MAEEEQMIPTPSDFGHFLLEKELGHGGMGGVYLARDKMLDRKVGIKVMLKSLGDDPRFVERFQREAQAAARLNHPNIAQIYSFGQENGMPYIAMELVSGGSLDKEMEEHLGTMDPVRVMRIGQQMADALALAADQGLVHGDVKPENVLFDNDGNAKLVDFGLAAMQGDLNEIWGTPYYISPEKVRRQKVDYRADIYSLGGTLYHVLTGVPPFDGEDPTAVVKARFEAPPKKPSEIRPDLPPEIDTIIMRMLELEPSMRYPTYQSLLGDFKRYLSKARPARTTGKLVSPKVKIKGTKPKIRLSAEEGAPGDDIAELPVGDLEETEEKSRFGVGAIVGMAVGGIVLLVLLVVGGLLWYVHADKVAKECAAHQEIVDTQARARTAIANTVKAVSDFGEKFHELVTKNDKEVATALKDLRGQIPAELKPVAQPFLDPPPSKDVGEAIAFTNEIFVAYAAEQAAAANQKAADEKAAAEAAKAATTNAVADAKAATNVTAAASAVTNKVAAAKADVKKDGPAKAVAKKDGSAEAEEKPVAGDEGKDEAKKDPAEDLPMAIKQFTEVWADIWFCRAADIRVQGGIKLLLLRAAKVNDLKEENLETTQELAKLSQQLVEGFDAIKSMKCVEQAQRKVNVVRTKCVSLVRSATQQIARARAKAEKAARDAAEKAAREEREAKLAEEHKAKAEAETKLIQEKADGLQNSIRTLDWERCIKQLEQTMSEFTTAEGREEGRSQIRKIQAMQGLQRHFAAKARGFRFRDGSVVSAADAKAITIQKFRRVKGKTVPDRTDRKEWNRFFGRKEYIGYVNQMLNGLVMKGRETTGIGPKPWSEHMLGSALMLQFLYADVEGVEKFIPVLVKTAVKDFEHCRKDAAKWFPDVELEATDE